MKGRIHECHENIDIHDTVGGHERRQMLMKLATNLVIIVLNNSL